MIGLHTRYQDPEREWAWARAWERRRNSTEQRRDCVIEHVRNEKKSRKSEADRTWKEGEVPEKLIPRLIRASTVSSRESES